MDIILPWEARDNLGRKASQEERQRRSVSMMGEKNHFFNKHHTADTNKKNSESQRGKIPWSKGLTKETDERINKISKNMSNIRKDKSYEQLYGIEKAKIIKQNLSFNKRNEKHPKFRKEINFQLIYDFSLKLNFELDKISKQLNCSSSMLQKRVKKAGFLSWTDFKNKKGIIIIC